MILKFKHIKNVGRYVDFQSAGDQTLKKLNFLYGENGRGKTSIAAILRSLCDDDPCYIQERRTLGTEADADIEVLLDGGMAKFDGTSWNKTHDGIEVFDHRFILENIHIGESVEIHNKRNLAGVILGKKGAEISQRIKEQDTAARAKLTELDLIEKQIKAVIPNGMTLAEYIALAVDADVEKKIKEKTTDIEAAKRATSIKTQNLITPLPVPVVPTDFAATLSETLSTVSTTAEAKVRAHLDADHMKDAEGWLSEGVEFMDGSTCPVCGRSVEGVGILTAYKDYFSEEYGLLRDKVAELEPAIDAALGDNFQRSYDRAVKANTAPFEFWKELLPISLPTVPNIKTLTERAASVKEAAKALIDKKKTSILDSVSADSLITPISEMDAAAADITKYNEAVTRANEAITALKGKTTSTDASALQGQLDRLMAVKYRHTGEAKAQITLLQACKSDRQKAVETKEKSQTELIEYSKAIENAHEQRINEILGDFAAGFRIKGVETEFPSGTPASNYCIEINKTSVEVGKAQESRPSFQTMLSTGDKSTLALAFFFSALEQDANKASKVVFLDDPFNSQDEHRRNQTGKLIHKAVSECAQVIVSSHEPSFLRTVWEGVLGDVEWKSLKLTRKGVDETTIVEWDIEHETKHPFLRLHDELTEYIAGTLTLRPSDVIQKPRLLLEDYFRFRFPNTFKRREWLGEMIGHFEAAGSAHPLYPHLADLRAINDYTSPTHHSSGAINESELRTHVEKLLGIVGST